MSTQSLHSLNRLVWVALMAAAVAVGAFLVVPIGPVPVSMQPFFVFLAGFLLGPKAGAACVLLYVAGGALGLPIFAQGKSGLGHLLGPTGGYLAGFIASAAVCGLATMRHRHGDDIFPWGKGLLIGLLSLVPVYGLGVGWLMAVLEKTLKESLVIGFVPFFPTDVVKVALAIAIYRHLQAKQLLPR